MAQGKAKTEDKKETLPRWDLSEYYSGIDDPQIEADFKAAEENARAFAAKYKGRIAELSGDELAAALEEEDAATRPTLEKIQYYSALLKSIEQNDPEVAKFSQKVNERGTAIAGDVQFFGLELKNMDADELRAKVKESKHLQQYEKVIDGVLRYQPYKLNDSIEEFLLRQSPAGAGQFVRLYTEDQARRRFPLRGEELTITQIRGKLDDPDMDLRKEAFKVFHDVTTANIHTPAFVMNTIIKDKEIMDKERGYAEPMSARNLANRVDDAVAHTMIDTVKANYGKTSQRFNKLKAEMLGKEKVDYWDSLIDIPGNSDTYIPWDEAKKMVLDGYREFSPQMAEIAEKFFDNGWIDAEPRPGKRGGAFAQGGHIDMHPHVMVNYQGKPRDVMTLAHELGHGVHQYLENHNLGNLNRGTPLNLAETASIFGEEIVFNKMLERISNPTEKKILLATKVADMLGTIVSQVAFADFERKIHNARREGELSPDDFANLWKESIQEQSGDTVGEKLPNSKNGWSNIPHMFHTPFYVYAYSFANLVVNSLVKANESGQVENFEQKYIEALKAGGTKDYAELVKPFGLDAHSPDFWQQGIDVLIDRIDQLEAAIKEEKALEGGKEAPAKGKPVEKKVADNEEPVRVDSIKVVGADRSKTQQNAKGR